MHLVVDAQCLQTDTIERGIGRYSLRLLRALGTVPGVRVTLLLNEIALSTHDKALMASLESFAEALPQVCRFHTRSARMLQFGRFRRQALTAREEAILELRPDWVLILSAFQSERQTVLAPREKTRNTPTAAILYDLIPLVFAKHFLYTPSLQDDYLSRLAVLKDCDVLLSISRASQEAWLAHIGEVPPTYVIGGASDSAHTSASVVPLEQRRGVICLGGETPNKNLHVLLKAHGALPKKLQMEHPLTITGIRQRGFARRLTLMYRGVPNALRIPGYVPESTLHQLLGSSRVLVMPSIMEGLGLPVFEAAAFGTPSIVSRGTSLQEINNDPAWAFNPLDPRELQCLLMSVLVDDESWNGAHQTALAESARFSWNGVADAAIVALRQHSA